MINPEMNKADPVKEEETYRDLASKNKSENVKNSIVKDNYKTLKDEKDTYNIDKYYINDIVNITDPENEKSEFEKLIEQNPVFGEYVDLNLSTKENLGYILYSVLDKYDLIVKLGNGVSLDYAGFVKYRGNMYNFLKTLFEPYGYVFEFQPPNILFIKAFDTRTYDLKFLNLDYEYNVDFQTSASGQGRGDYGDVNTAQNLGLIVTSNTQGIWDAVSNEIQVMISSDGTASVNKNMGQITVTDRIPFLGRIEKYINSVNDTYNKQVFLDVTLIEVTLSEGHQYGVDWGFLRSVSNGHALGFYSNISPAFKDTIYSSPPSLDKFKIDIPVFTVENIDGLTRFIIGGLKESGKVSVKAHPKQMVLNNQPAIIPIGNIITYLRSLEKDENGWGGYYENSDWTFETATIQDGITLQFLPKVIDNDKIVMQIAVLLNKLLSMNEINVGEELKLQLPQTSSKADSTVIKMKSGQSMIIGGLIREDSENNDRKVPLLGDIPYLGNLFKWQMQSKTKTELVIVLTAKVIKM
jgi:MSHA type pilus biogenesis protein MshL